MLLEAGASVNPGSDDGWSPLRYAQYNEDDETIALLKVYGATS